MLIWGSFATEHSSVPLFKSEDNQLKTAHKPKAFTNNVHIVMPQILQVYAPNDPGMPSPKALSYSILLKL